MPQEREGYQGGYQGGYHEGYREGYREGYHIGNGLKVMSLAMVLQKSVLWRFLCRVV